MGLSSAVLRSFKAAELFDFIYVCAYHGLHVHGQDKPSLQSMKLQAVNTCDHPAAGAVP